MFAVLHIDINLHKSGLLYLTGQPYSKKSRSAKVKDGIINLFLSNYLIHTRTFAPGRPFQPSLMFASKATEWSTFKVSSDFTRQH